MKNAMSRLILCALVMLELFPASAYAGSETNLPTDKNTNLTVSEQTGTYGGTINLVATLTSEGKPLEGFSVSFYFEGSNYSKTTNANGVATAYGVSLSGINAGTYNGYLSAKFLGVIGYNESSGSGKLTVNQAPSNLSLGNVNAQSGAAITLTATLTSGSTPISGKTVSFTVNSVSKGTAVTGTNGVATLKNVNTSGLGAGSYTIGASYSGAGENYASSAGTGTLNITELPTSLTVSSVTGTYGSTVTLQAKLTSSGSALSGKTITFTLNGSTYTAITNAGGDASASGVSIAGINAGKHTGAISASFAASGGYAAASGTGELSVDPASTSLSVANATGNYGGTTSLSATLTSGGSAVSNQTITFSLNGIQVGHAETGVNGTATLPNVFLGGINAGTYTMAVTAIFTSSGNYTGSSGSANLTVDKAITMLSVSNSTGAYGGLTSLTAALTSSSAGLPGMSINFKVNGVLKGSAQTDANGNATLNNISLTGLGVGSYAIEAAFSPSGGNYAPGIGKGTLNVSELPTELLLRAIAGIYGGMVTLSATLTSSGAPLEGKTIIFTLSGSIYSSQTNASGVASVSGVSIKGIDAGTYTGTVTASFTASGGYAAASATGDLTVQQAPTSLSVSSVAGIYGGTAELSAALTSGGNPLSGMSVYFKLNGSSVGSAVTGTNGVAEIKSVSLAGINAGLYNSAIEADFAASGNYSSSAGAGSMTVDQATTTTLVANSAGVYNGKVSLSATLTVTSSGLPLFGQTLSFKLNGVSVGTGVTDKSGTAKLDNISIADIDAGTYNDYIEASYSPAGGNYVPSTSKGQLQVIQASTSLALSNVEADYGSTVTLKATITSSSVGLKGLAINFTISGVSKGSALTDAKGAAALNNVSIAGIEAGTYNNYIGASFSPAGGNYSSSSASANLKVDALTTSLAVLNSTGTYGGTVTLEAALTSSGLPLAGRTITFTFNGSQYTATTNSSGVASAAGVSISGIDAGTHTGVITADLAASGGYAAASAKGDLTVEAAYTALSVSNASGTFGETLSLSAILTSGGTPLAGRSVNFKLGSASVGSTLTDANGAATIIGVSLQGYNAGFYSSAVTAEFTAEGDFASSSGSGNLTVTQAPTTLLTGKVSGTYGGTITLTAVINVTSSGSKISGQTISFKLNGKSLGTADTDINGLAALNNVSSAGISVGTYSDYIEAGFSPSGGNYASSTGKGQLEVTPASTSLIVNNVEAAYGSAVSLTAALSSGAEFLSGRTVSFTVDNVFKGNAVTDANGVATLVNVNLSGIGVGTYNNYIGASFLPYNDNYTGSSAAANLEINELPTILSIKNVTGTFGGTINLEAALTSSGSPLNGRTIYFTVNGNPAGSAITGSSGAASLAFSLAGYDAGSYSGKIKADFTASGGYVSASATGDFTVEQAHTSLSVSSVAGTYGETVNLSAALTSGGNPLSGMSVNFKLNGVSLGSAVTETNGAAEIKSVSLSGIVAGDYTGIIVADFAAAGNYNSSTGSGNLKVSQAPTTTLVIKSIGEYNGKVSLIAALNASSSGSPLSGHTLSFKLNGKFVGNAVTEENGKAILADVSLAGISVGTYKDYIEAGYLASGGSYASSTAKGQLEVGLAPTSLAVEKIAAVYGSKVTLKATLTTQGLPLSGKTIDFTLNNVSAGSAVTDVNGAAFKSNVDLTGLNTGLHSGCIGASFVEVNPYKSSSSQADLEIAKASTAVSVIANEVQYSDQVIITAVVTSAVAQGNLNTSGGSVEFKYQLGNGAVTSLGTVTSSRAVNGSLNFSYKFTCTLSPKVYKILVTFTPADQVNFDGSSNTNPWGPLTVEREDALAEYSGLTYFSTASSTTINVTLSFSAALTDIDDDYRGDISKARIEFREVPINGLFDNGIVRGTNLPVLLVNTEDKTIGAALTQPFSRNLSQSEINNLGTTFNVYTKLSGYYSKLSDPALITIGIPGNDNISGGGFLVSKSPAGKYRIKAGSKTNFGFTMKYNKSGKNNQGQANIIIRGEDDKIYQITSNAINSISVYSIKGSSGRAASFNTKANLKDITDPFNPVSLGGSLPLAVEMYDDGGNNENDAIAITLQDPNSELLFSSNWSGSKTALQTLSTPNGAGNIKVLSSTGLAKETSEEKIPKEYALFQNFPNPFNPSTNIQFDLPEDSRVNVVIYNILGREIATLVNDELPAGKHQAIWNSQDGGGQFASGMYILRITAKSLLSQRSMVSTKKLMLVK